MAGSGENKKSRAVEKLDGAEDGENVDDDGDEKRHDAGELMKAEKRAKNKLDVEGLTGSAEKKGSSRSRVAGESNSKRSRVVGEKRSRAVDPKVTKSKTGSAKSAK